MAISCAGWHQLSPWKRTTILRIAVLTEMQEKQGRWLVTVAR